MPKNDQIQLWFQPEIQANPQIQQNNLVQNQQQISGTTQQIIQQNNSVQSQQPVQETTQQDAEKQVQETKKRLSRLNKISAWKII